MLLEESGHHSKGSTLEEQWKLHYKQSCFFRAFEESGRITEVHCYTFNGNFTEDCVEWDGGPDPFEIEIGNTLVYSYPLAEFSNRFSRLTRDWLPYYAEERRLRRLKMNEGYLLDHIDRIEPYVVRDLHFQANSRLRWAFEKFLQNLFISKRVYPLCYDKWIKLQITEILVIGDLMPKLGKLFEISDFYSYDLISKGDLLLDLYKEYIRDPEMNEQNAPANAAKPRG